MVPLRPLLLLLTGFLLIGGPMALLIWRELSELLLGRVHPGPLALAAVLLVAFLWLARRLGRRLQRMAELADGSLTGGNGRDLTDRTTP